MKSKALFSFAALAMIGGGLAWVNVQSHDGARQYIPRSEQHLRSDIHGALEHYRILRGNPATGQFDNQAMLRARQEVQAFSSLQKTNSLDLQWEELGPDNVGGRTRAILVDKNNSSKVYAGSVSGGLWYSTSGGGSWQQHPDVATNLAVASIIQAANGDIYVGTGEGMYYNSGQGTGGIVGGGVYKSTDGGSSFTLISSTVPAPNSNSVDWASVNRLAADPSNSNRIYAATNRGLRVTDDGGTNWFNPIYIGSSTTADTKSSSDVEVTSDGTVFAVVGGIVHKSTSGNDNTFTNLMTSGSGLPTGIGRIELAVAPSDPNYVYAAAGTSSGVLYNVYRSTDKGNTFNSIVIDNNGSVGSNDFFEPYNGQAGYDNALAVFPNDKNKVILGGVELWTWEEGTGWVQIGSEFKSPYNPYYVHADKHEFRFDPNNGSTLYIGCDGGIFKSTDGASTFKAMNKGYSVTQYYSVAYQLSGEHVAGGAQDNGTTLINTQTLIPGLNSLKSGADLYGGDGVYTDFAASLPNAMFAGSQYGNVTRSAAATKGGAFASFYETRMTALGTPGTNGYGPFVSIFRIWEGFWGDPTVPGNKYDDCFAVALGIRDATKGTGGGIWITRDALNFSTTPSWYNIATIDGGDVLSMEFTDDGDHLFVGTSFGSLYRIDSIGQARTFDRGDVSGDSLKVVSKVVKTFSQPVTGIGINHGDGNHVVVTLGGYGSTNPYIYESTNALTTASFTSIQGNLPKMPVYDAAIDRFNSNRIIIGTDYGVYSTDDGGASWTEQNNDLGRVPVFMVRMQDRDQSGAFSSRVYIATHGRGAWRSSTLTSVPKLEQVNVSDLQLFPNPMREGVGNIRFTLDEPALVQVAVYDLAGHVVWKRDAAHVRAGEHQITFQGQELSAGAYLVNLQVNGQQHSSKLLVTK
ncbi:MAG: T9SS type A sorting domain-containing protein [Flavobacteriales bacterium]|nr:T9SS type A sorting domain-containing protein [Flavobacteriales bacterium]MCB9447182.1 T9SS type A sorting domain-containing protein [Flavobacteriales bacterium]